MNESLIKAHEGSGSVFHKVISDRDPEDSLILKRDVKKMQLGSDEKHCSV